MADLPQHETASAPRRGTAADPRRDPSPNTRHDASEDPRSDPPSDSQRDPGPSDLEELLARIEHTARNAERVDLRRVLESLGDRTFAPVLLLAGLVTLAPLVGDIPGVPTLMGTLVLLTALQMLFRRKHLWLPDKLLDRSVSQDKLCKALNWMQRPARWIDKVLRPRLTKVTHGAGRMAVALTCLLIALAMPAMEFVPFSANGAGVALTAFGLALVAQDGLLALFSFAVTGATVALVVTNLL